MKTFRRLRSALTLFELLVVLAILVAVAGLLVPMVRHVNSGPSIPTPSGEKSAQRVATDTTMARIKEAIIGAGGNPGYYGDLGALPRPQDGSRPDHPQLRYLFVNPATEDSTRDFDPNSRRGWRGPYVVTVTGRYRVDRTRGFLDLYGEDDDPALVDAWGNPVVITLRDEDRQTNAYLLSAGSDGFLSTADDIELTLRENL